MAIKMVREPSETPNINNIDDIIPMRYAYGGQNGFVIGKGTEISNTVSGLNFTVNSGRLVLQGVECDIDATGVTITIDNIATKRYYTIYLEVNLGLNTATIKDEYDTATYPTIDVGDDLTENSTGIARLPLYQFTATSGIIGEVNKVVESVKYAKDIKVNNAINADNAINSVKNNNGTFSSLINDKNDVLKNDNNIISKKILLWKGQERAYASSIKTITLNENVSIGDTIEVNLAKGNAFPLENYPEDNNEFYKFKIIQFSSSKPTYRPTVINILGIRFNPPPTEASREPGINISNCAIFIPSSNQLTFSSWVGEKLGGTGILGDQMAVLYSVYKIIE